MCMVDTTILLHREGFAEMEFCIGTVTSVPTRYLLAQNNQVTHSSLISIRLNNVAISTLDPFDQDGAQNSLLKLSEYLTTEESEATT